jgi:Protein of unknown function (DUF2799)
MRTVTLGLVLTALLGGCATMNKSECLTVDWQTVGFEDGVAGYSGDRIGQHRKACAKYGVSPDLVGYQNGREAGLREFCEPANGFRLGSRGAGYAGICPAELETAFSTAYESGRQLYTLEARVSTAQNQIVSKRRELEHIEDELVKKAAIIVTSDSTSDQRAQALVDTKQMAERAGRLKAEMRQLERDRVLYERELEDYQATLANTR